MDKKELMLKFIKTIENKKILTPFIKNLFDYEELYDYNYLFRITDDKDMIIIDIYDNISDNRFNRYIFNFTKGDYDYKVEEINNVFVTNIYVNNLKDTSNKLLKLAYLFSINCDNMIKYAQTFLDDKFIEILKK